MSRARDILLSGVVLLLSRRRKPPQPDGHLLPPVSKQPRAETAAITLLFLAALCAAAFPVVYFVHAIPAKTQYLGLSIGLALLFLAAALIVVAETVIPTEELAHDYPPDEHEDDEEYISGLVEESGKGFTRRGLFKLGLFSAGGALGVAALIPAVSFGPDVHEKALYTAFPEGADKEEQGSAVVVVRLPRSSLKLSGRVEGYDADGIVAYSKLCTHAGCAISLYRAPLFAPDEPRPALVCPCHYSTFDPADGGSVTFGPAGRRLPMLPLSIDGNGGLRARGNFDGPVGPSWWGVRERRPRP
jgi:ubiquinol-cytochrome c reductase iron-sulfur subunit